MTPWILAAASVILLYPSTAQETKPAQPPASQPPDTTILRRPAQANILKNLLAREERAMPVRPDSAISRSGQTTGDQGLAEAARQPTLPEGTFLVERPGRLVREDGRPMFVFHADGSTSVPTMMELCPNQLLELMEREATAGVNDFIVSGEVTQYRDRNYLILRKILRRVGHGNLAP